MSTVYIQMGASNKNTDMGRILVLGFQYEAVLTLCVRLDPIVPTAVYLYYGIVFESVTLDTCCVLL